MVVRPGGKYTNIGSIFHNLSDEQDSKMSYLEEFLESRHADIIPTEVGSHGGVDVVGIQLLVDLLVDAGFAFDRVVLAESWGHL